MKLNKQIGAFKNHDSMLHTYECRHSYKCAHIVGHRSYYRPQPHPNPPTHTHALTFFIGAYHTDQILR